VVVFHEESGWTAVNGLLEKGWAHQVPLFAKSTICSPGLPPTTRPAMLPILADPPGPASGTSVNWIDGGTREKLQPPNSRCHGQLFVSLARKGRTGISSHVLHLMRDFSWMPHDAAAARMGGNF
jgi:hypothetical protein